MLDWKDIPHGHVANTAKGEYRIHQIGGGTVLMFEKQFLAEWLKGNARSQMVAAWHAADRHYWQLLNGKAA